MCYEEYTDDQILEEPIHFSKIIQAYRRAAEIEELGTEIEELEDEIFFENTE